jgi:hypothetical protein
MILEPPNDIDVLYTLAKIESQVTNDIGLDLLEHIRVMEHYERRLTPEDRRFLHALRIATD